MNTQKTDNLILSLASGNIGALECLYDDLSKPVYFYAFRLCQNREIAEDVMQETFLTVWEKATSFSAQNGRSWIFTIAKNKTLDKLRDRSKRVEWNETEHLSEDSSIETALSDMAFWQRLSPLSERERDVVSLRLLSGFTLTEVANELGVPKGTVFWIYSNAIKKLKNDKGGDR